MVSCGSVDDKLAAYLRSGYLIGLLPVAINLAAIAFTPLQWGLGALIGRGELLLLALGLSFGAVLDLPSTNLGMRARDRFSTMCVLCIVGAVIVSTALAFARAYGDQPNELMVSVVSLIVYIPSVYASARCVTAIERRDR